MKKPNMKKPKQPDAEAMARHDAVVQAADGIKIAVERMNHALALMPAVVEKHADMLQMPVDGRPTHEEILSECERGLAIIRNCLRLAKMSKKRIPCERRFARALIKEKIALAKAIYELNNHEFAYDTLIDFEDINEDTIADMRSNVSDILAREFDPELDF